MKSKELLISELLEMPQERAEEALTIVMNYNKKCNKLRELPEHLRQEQVEILLKDCLKKLKELL